MTNIKPYQFTQEDRSKGGKKAAIKRLNTNLINKMMTDYIEGVNEFEGVSLLDDLMTLSPKERITFLINYLPYERPKLASIEQVVEVTEMAISKEERQSRIKEILLKTG